MGDKGAHACKGQNACKGQGGCKTGDQGCKGKNTCKGKGGCASKEARPTNRKSTSAASAKWLDRSYRTSRRFFQKRRLFENEHFLIPTNHARKPFQRLH